MRTGWTSLVATLMAGGAFGAEPFARVTIPDSDNIVPGQQVQVTVDVFAPNFFTSPPQFPLFDIPNALVTLPEERSQNLTETIDGVQYSGIRHSYAIVPEMAGTFALPPVTIEFSYSNDGKFVRGTAQLPPTQFTAVSPTGNDGTRLPFAARGVGITQTFDRDPAKLKVGEALVRTVVVFAGNTQAMLIPPLDIAQTPGLQIYSQSPRLADGVNHDQTVGSSRTETITYVAAATGAFQIPPVSLEWFDTATGATKTASLPAVSLTVVKAPAAIVSIAPQVDDAVRPPAHQQTTRMIAVIALLIAALGAAFIAGRHWLQWVRQWFWQRRKTQENSEPYHFRRLQDAIKHDTPQNISARLDDWCRAIGFRTASSLAAASGDANLSRQLEELNRLLYGSSSPEQPLDRAALADPIIRCRQARRRVAHPTLRNPLPELNP